jgi:hypothetical protein
MEIIPHFDQSVDDSPYAAQIRNDINYVCNLYDGLFTNNVTINIEIPGERRRPAVPPRIPIPCTPPTTPP